MIGSSSGGCLPDRRSLTPTANARQFALQHAQRLQAPAQHQHLHQQQQQRRPGPGSPTARGGTRRPAFELLGVLVDGDGEAGDRGLLAGLALFPGQAVAEAVDLVGDALVDRRRSAALPRSAARPGLSSSGSGRARPSTDGESQRRCCRGRSAYRPLPGCWKRDRAACPSRRLDQFAVAGELEVAEIGIGVVLQALVQVADRRTLERPGPARRRSSPRKAIRPRLAASNWRACRERRACAISRAWPAPYSLRGIANR